MIERQGAFDLSVVDSDTSDLDPSKIIGTLQRFPFSWAYAPNGMAFGVMRLLNWSLHAIVLTAAGLFAKDRFDFVYVPYSEILPVAVAGYVVGKARRIPIVFCNLNVRGIPLWALNRALHKRADYIVTLSRSLAAEIRAEGISVPIGIGSVGVDDEALPRAAIKYDAVYVGRHTKEKGIFDALDVWEKCTAREPSLRLVLAGPCTEDVRKKLDSLLAARGLSGNVTILGPVSERAKWELYAQSRLCLFPSHVEGWGIVPIEAHLAGIRVVAYDLEAYEETIRYSPSATLVPVGDTEAAASAVLATLARNEDDERMRIWARKFTWDHAVDREIELIGEALRRDLAANPA